MKPSHFSTPRSMREGQWHYDADPIEYDGPMPFDTADWVVMVACLLALFTALVIGVWPW